MHSMKSMIDCSMVSMIFILPCIIEQKMHLIWILFVIDIYFASHPILFKIEPKVIIVVPIILLSSFLWLLMTHSNYFLWVLLTLCIIWPLSSLLFFHLFWLFSRVTLTSHISWVFFFYQRLDEFFILVSLVRFLTLLFSFLYFSLFLWFPCFLLLLLVLFYFLCLHLFLFPFLISFLS